MTIQWKIITVCTFKFTKIIYTVIQSFPFVTSTRVKYSENVFFFTFGGGLFIHGRLFIHNIGTQSPY